MKNLKAVVLLMVMLVSAPISGYSQSQPAGAAGGMSVGTAVAIGVVGAALLVALGDSSSSAAAGVTPAASDSNAAASSTAAVTSSSYTTTETAASATSAN